MTERGLLLGDNGAGRMCIDYWPVKGSTKFSAVTNLFDRWAESKCGQRQPQVSYMSVPGDKGALSTMKIEAFREGIQGSEARIFIEKALAAKKITGALAEKCQAFLDKRAHFFIVVHSNSKPISAAYNNGWQESYKTLYTLAGEVAAALGTK